MYGGVLFNVQNANQRPVIFNAEAQEMLQTTKKTKQNKKQNKLSKGNKWSAIPDALLCMVVNRNERQGSGTKEDKVL